MSDPLLIQKAIRQNSNDIFQFSKELKSWREDMEVKENTLKKDKQSSSALKKEPPEHKVGKKVKLVEKKKAPAAKIGSTDYAAWDKFDADAEMEKLEEDIKDDSDLTDEFNENIYDEALVEKEKGNKFVKNQEWAQAIKCYSKAIECYSYDPIFYANRALCYLKLSKYEEAENDCNLSIKLDDTYVKAYQRRAAARMYLNKLQHAEVDLQKVLIIEPNNKESKAELLKLSVLLKRDKEKPEQRPISKFTATRRKTSSNNVFPVITQSYNPPQIQPKRELDNSQPVSMWPLEDKIIPVKSIKKPPHLRSQKPLRRIEIIEVDGIEPQNKGDVAVVENKEKIMKMVTENREEPLKNQIQESPKLNSSVKKEISEKIVKDTERPSVLPNPENNFSCLRSEDLKVIERKNETNSNEIKNTNNKLTEETPVYFDYPKNSVQFFHSWKNLKSSVDKYEYWKSIKAQDVPKLFLNSLDSAILSSILEIMTKHFIENHDPVYNLLNCFTEVKRFGAIVMFMSYEDKKNLWKLIDYMKENNEVGKEDVDRLIEKFEL